MCACASGAVWSAPSRAGRLHDRHLCASRRRVGAHELACARQAMQTVAAETRHKHSQPKSIEETRDALTADASALRTLHVVGGRRIGPMLKVKACGPVLHIIELDGQRVGHGLSCARAAQTTPTPACTSEATRDLTWPLRSSTDKGSHQSEIQASRLSWGIMA